MVQISKKQKRTVYNYLFQEGCLICLNDTFRNHATLKGIPNLSVIMMMKSFESKKFVRKTYAWKHHYWFLTNEGIEFLRGYLQLPSTIVPNTLRSPASVKRGPARDQKEGEAKEETQEEEKEVEKDEE